MRKILQRSLGAWGSKLGILWVLASLMGTYAQAQVNANFTADVTSGCSPLTVRFTDLSTGNVNEWFWDFGNGNTSTFDDVIAVYSVPGTYTVSLTVRDTVGGFLSTRTETGYITVFNDPAADFAVDTNSGCAPLSVNFSENVTLGDAGIQSYTWDFGDGNLGSGANPNHIYTAAGTFTATLVVVDSNGCQDTRIYNDLVTVSDVANISFTATPQTGCAAPLTVTFNSTVTPTGTYSYLWDFGDGNTSNAEDPTHIYLANGDYDVSLTIIDGSGCQETVTQTNFVLINQPTAEFSALDTTICTGQSIQFINESIGADSYLWNFGDGNTSTQTNPFHTYATPGTYSVSLEAINSAGCSDIEGKSGYITVNVTPAPGFTADQNISCNSPMFVNFTDNSTGTNIAWEWDFGNGSFSLSQNPTTVYLTPGLYDVSLTVTSADGCQATETVPNYIFLGQPDAEFAMSRVEGCIPLSVEFTDLSTSPTDPIVTWSWNFGDGTGSAQQNPTHVYTAPGQYTVTLTTITASGCTNVETFQFIEAGTLPTAEFDANPLVACVGDVIQFQDLTTGGATEWEWNFGDDPLGSAQQNPAYTYNDTGSFNITLVVSNLGCRDTLTKLDFIRINGPVADFSFTPTVGCNPPLTVAFLDESSVADTYIWDFGDGNTSTAQNPTHTYTGTGDFTITLTVSSTTTGCVDNEQANISITNPTANFTSDVDFGCGPLEVNFTETSSNATAFFWDFGDGNTSTAANPTHTYAASGEFTVTLIASDGNCADTLVRTNYIDVIGPDANFSAGTLTGCAPLGVTFTDLSVADSGTSLVNWQWDFGDGGVGTGPNPTYTFNTPGDYDITLRVLDSEGCIDSITRTSYIQPTFPTAEFTTTDSTGCPGSLISFINQSIGQGLSYNWDFGDGTSSSAPNPIHLFPGNGNYNITLTVTDANGCSDARVKSSFISIANPTANFVADTTSATCPPLTVNFTDISSADVVSWYWDFGDGSTSTLANPSKIYATAGDFTVRLIVESNDGCRDTMEMTDLVQISGPTGTFGFNPVAGCNPLNVTFSVNSPDPSYTYDWDFGDGTGGTGTTINHTYFNDTTINPTMLIEDASGCIVSVTSPNPVEIYPLPVPAYTVTVTEICLGESLTFTNTTTSERAIVDFTWIFGDGDSSNLTNPSHTYLDTGMYVVQLVATTVDGCEDTAASPITIRVTAPPTAAFTAAPTAACEPASVAFLESSSGYFPIVDWAWDFGDGVGDNGQIITPHTYINDGIYAATLTVTDNRGCTGSSMRNITVNPLPDVDFSAFRYGCAPLPVAFTDLTTGSFPATDWEWDFGDGLTSTQQNPTHIYANDGNYTVTLTVTDTNGCRRTLTRNNYIQLGRPNAAFSSNAGITCPPQTVNFNNLSLGDTTISYAWDFGDGVTSNLANPTHTYSTSDTFDVRLVVTNIFGCTDTALDPQHVITYDLPIPSFTVSDSQACVPENIIFTSTSTPSPSGAALVSYQWDFGTGTGTTTPTTSFLYTSDGTYTASLTVTDANGCSNSTTRTIRIFPDPVVDFVAGDTVGCAVTSIGFTDMTTGSFAPVTWLWDFGDGTTGTGQNPVHTYFNDGSYDIKLVATDINGCVDSLTRPNYINLDHPDADFNVSAVLACPGEVISFTDISTGPFAIVTWDWDFGDGSISNAQDPSHAYASPGTYTVTLIVSDGINCRDTIVKTALVNVYTGPSAAYTYVPSNGCNPLTVNFTDGSSSGSVGIVSHLWTFGDGNGSAQQNPIYTFTSPGVYDVRLLVTDANGCVDTVTQSVEVFEVPDVAFTADIRRGCSPLTVNFSDLTTSPYVKVAWEWDFGDGNTSNAPSPSHTYTDNGDYTVKLVVTDQNGCKDSVIHNDFIRLSQPFANFTLDRAEVCPNEPIGVQFTDGTVHDTTLTSWSWSFGTGDNSTDQNPLYTYATPGVYNVTLEVTDLLGCTDDTTFTNIISVLTPATASFMMSDTLDCTPLGISFTDTSVPGDTALQAWLWDFGTGDSSLQQNPSYVWTTPGIYTVRLTVTDENGCLTTDSTTVQAYELPTADFFTADTLGCSPAVITFTENSTSAAPIAYRRWDFGDGTFVENVLNPTKTYAGDGDYTVSLLVRDVNG
ncbi:MAG: PKD domain-containing protein, partial [Bacteroidota bacterium]